MRTIEVKLYTFNELTDEAKAKVLEAHRYINVDWDDWHEGILEDWTEKLTAYGFPDAEINYTGFYSQGDGASFTCKAVELAQFLRAEKLATKYRALYDAAKEGYITASIDRIEQQATEVEALLQERARELSQQIYRDLRSAYEAETEDEAVIDTIEANEYEFTADGKIA